MRARLLLALTFGLLVGQGVAQAGAKPRGYRAAIDMGSSGIRMTILDKRGRTVVDQEIGVALGKGLAADRLLPRKNRELALGALQTFIGRAARYGIRPSDIELITTAAVRNAKGRVSAAARTEGRTTGRRFLIDEVQGKLGLTRARIITGRREALLGYQGTLIGWRGRSKGPFLVIDTGGSSHQVSWGTRRVVSQAGSTQIGSNFVAEKILVDERGRPLDAMTAADLARADRRMAEAVPALPEGVTPPPGATPILTGDVSRYLSYYFGKHRVTIAEVAALRARMAAVPMAERALLARADVHGRPFTPREKDRLGLHATNANGDDYGGKLPAKLTLLLRVMALTNTQALHLSKTDARNALLR